MPASIALILLAAGASTRMGQPKQLLAYRGRSLIRYGVEVGMASVCQPIVVVVGANGDRIRGELADLPIHVVENPDWAGGSRTSIRRGIEFLETVPEYIGAAVLAVCDQPLLTARVIDQLVYTHRKLEKSIVASDYADTFGIPTLFSRELFPELLALSGGDGAKSVIERHLDEVISVPFAGGAIDLDTPEDYAKFLADEIVDEKADEMVDEMVDERGDEKADERAD